MKLQFPPTYTVIVAKATSTDPIPGDHPFWGHQVIESRHQYTGARETIIVRFARFHRLLGALRYRRTWRRLARADARLSVSFTVGAVTHISLGEFAVPAAVSQDTVSTRQ